jgi:ribosomal-protein-alanine N-acetyltransferase
MKNLLHLGAAGQSNLWRVEAMIFESERLNFRLLEKDDADELFGIWGDCETMQFCGGPLEKVKIYQIIDYNLSQYNSYGNAVFAVIEIGKLIGICEGKLDEDNPFHVEVIIHIAKTCWHKGYAAEAVQAYIKWLKAGKKASYLYASAHPCNR